MAARAIRARKCIVDLEATLLTLPNGVTVRFPIEAFARHCLLNGLDELGYLRSKLDEIERYEAVRPRENMQ